MTNEKLIIKHKITNEIICEVEKINGFYDLRYKNLKFSDLTGADLKGANLMGADLTGADLTGADLVQYHDKKWNAYIQIEHIRIGCKCFTVSEWENFTDDEISKMDKDALSYWKKNKSIIFAIHKNLVEEKSKNGN